MKRGVASPHLKWIVPAAGCAVLTAVLVVGFCALILVEDERRPSTASTPTPAPLQSPEVPAGPRWTEASGNIWSGVKLYYRPNGFYIGEVVCGGERADGTDLVYVQMEGGSVEPKERGAVRGWWVREDDPAIEATRWCNWNE